MINRVLLRAFVMLLLLTHIRVEECSEERGLTEMSDESELIRPVPILLHWNQIANEVKQRFRSVISGLRPREAASALIWRI